MPVAAAVPKNEPTITAEGLMLAGAVLAKAGRDRHGMAALIIDGDEERILALLALAYDRAIGPAVLRNIRRASDNWGRGEPVLAAIDLALGGLSCLDDADAASIRVSLGDKLLGDGLSPRDLLKGCGLDPAPLDLLKAGFNVLEPRIPAGNGRGSGDWTTGGTGLGQPEGSPSSPVTLINYTHVYEMPSDAKAVIPPDGVPIRDKDSPTKRLMAPPRADFHEVYAAGKGIASLPILEQYSRTRAAIAQEGIYDFQRDVPQQKFHDPYIHAANYAAGVYMAGAGYSLTATLALAKLYALRNSKNYDAQDQLGWIQRGWKDATAGRWR